MAERQQDTLTEAEQDQFEGLTEKIAHRMVSGEDPREALKILVSELKDGEDMQDSRKLDIARAATELHDQMLKGAKSKREEDIAEEYGGKIQRVIDRHGEERFVVSGVTEDFVVHARAKEGGVTSADIQREVKDLGGEFWVGGFFDRIIRDVDNAEHYIDDQAIGRLVNGDRLNRLVQSRAANVAERKILQRRLKLVKSRRESAWQLAKGAGLGAVTKWRSNERNIVFAGVGGAWNFGEKLLDQSYVGRDGIEVKKLSGQIVELTREINEKGAIIDATVEKLTTRSEDTEAKLESGFGEQIEELVEKSQNASPDFKTVRENLIKDVKAEDKLRGNKNLQTVLMKRLADEGFDQDIEKGELLTPNEKQARRIAVAQFARDIVGSDVLSEPRDIEEFVEILEDKDPALLKLIYEGKVPMEFKELPTLLFGGELKELKKVKEFNKLKLKKGRRMPFSPENLAKIMGNIRYYLDTVGDYNRLRNVMKDFVENWQKVPADKFDSVFSRLVSKKEGPEKSERKKTDEEKEKKVAKKTNAFIRKAWAGIMPEGAKLKKADAKELQKALERHDSLKGDYKEMLQNSQIKHIIGAFFGNRSSLGIGWAIRERSLDPTVNNFVLALSYADKFLKLTSVNSEIQYVFKTFLKERPGKSVADLDPTTFKVILDKKEKENKEAAAEEDDRGATVININRNKKKKKKKGKKRRRA